MGYKKARHYQLSGSAKKVGKSLTRSSKEILLMRVLLRSGMMKEAAVRIGKAIRKEIKVLCSDNHNSIMRERSRTAMEHFSWESIWTEVQTKAPILAHTLQTAVSSSDDSRMIPILCTDVSMLLKARNPRCAWCMYYGHAGRQLVHTLK